jgi:hypothetical protein
MYFSGDMILPVWMVVLPVSLICIAALVGGGGGGGCGIFNFFFFCKKHMDYL